MNLLLPEVEVSTNKWSDAQSDVTDWTLSHNFRKTQMTDDEKIWRHIRIRIRQFLHKKQMRQVWAFYPGPMLRLKLSRSACHPPPRPLRQWPFYLYTVE